MDFLMWIGYGFGALAELFILHLTMPGNRPRAAPSEIAAVVFFVLLFGPASLIAISMVLVLMVIVGSLFFIGSLLDEMFGSGS